MDYLAELIIIRRNFKSGRQRQKESEKDVVTEERQTDATLLAF